MISLPDKQYSIIYEDPAWTYTDKALAGNRGAGCKYNLMTKEELMKLPVDTIAKPDSMLFMWVTFPKLLDGTALDVMKAHGFTPKTCAFNWVKYNKKAYTPFMGMGSWTRANTEICLLGVKGKPQRISASVRQLLQTIEYPEVIDSKLEGHSKKPDIVRDRIVELCGDLPRIELFARQTTLGWDTWGDEIEILI